MYNENIKFHSGRDYPPIENSGSTAFSKGSSPTSITLTTVDTTDEYLVFKEVGGYRSLLNTGEDSSGTYRVGNTLYAYLGDFDTYSGTIYWRIYGN